MSNFTMRRLVALAAILSSLACATPRASTNLEAVGVSTPTVYVFDDGIDGGHPEILGRVRLLYAADPSDRRFCNNHGTGVAIAAAGKTLGVNPRARLVDARIRECRHKGGGTLRHIFEAIDSVVADKKRHGGPAVAVWAFRGVEGVVPSDRITEQMDLAIMMLVEAGITVVVSAGNSEMDACNIAPASSPRAIVIGAAVQKDGERGVVSRSHNTAYGPCVTLYTSPEISIRSLASQTEVISNGTSIASARAAGMVSLFLERNPRATPDEVRTGLIGMAREERNGGELLMYISTNRLRARP